MSHIFIIKYVRRKKYFHRFLSIHYFLKFIHLSLIIKIIIISFLKLDIRGREPQICFMLL